MHTIGFSYGIITDRKGVIYICDFDFGSVPISVAAKVFKKDANWIRSGIISGWLDIGIATRNGERVTSISEMDSNKGRINYYISPKKLYEVTGYVWKGEKNGN